MHFNFNVFLTLDAEETFMWYTVTRYHQFIVFLTVMRCILFISNYAYKNVK